MDLADMLLRLGAGLVAILGGGAGYYAAQQGRVASRQAAEAGRQAAATQRRAQEWTEIKETNEMLARGQAECLEREAALRVRLDALERIVRDRGWTA